jgi:CRISPR/Cas system CSM-associated protein Csm3 (group 7 of RAMP superfamily)
MPQDEAFWNPYRLIPVREKVDRQPPITDDKFKGISGIIQCRLTNLTPLFVGKNRNNHQMFLTRKTEHGERYVIPGSSLKGLLRSLGEIVGGGCFVTGFYDKKDKNFSPCNDADKLCITCRIFGMMERGKGARVHKGKVSIGDALLVEDKPETSRFQILLANCGTRHEPFYRSPHTGALDGKSRKMYFHQPNRKDSVPNVPENLKPRAEYIDALLPGHHFEFDIQFSNLEQNELDLLLYTLILEEDVKVTISETGQVLKGPLRHKVGNAKPLGLGSCHIRIIRLALNAEPKERFTSLDRHDRVLKDDNLEEEIGNRIKPHISDSSPTMEAMRSLMVWDETDPRDFRYPDYNWFQNSVNSGKTLKRI